MKWLGSIQLKINWQTPHIIYYLSGNCYIVEDERNNTVKLFDNVTDCAKHFVEHTKLCGVRDWWWNDKDIGTHFMNACKKQKNYSKD